MNPKNKYYLLKHTLSQMGYSREFLETLESEGHIILSFNDSQSVLLVPSDDGKALFILTRLITVDPSRDTKVLALALNLNLSPVHTLAASIALDLENQSLYLRATHQLFGSQSDNLESALEQYQHLAKQILQILTDYQNRQRAAVDQARFAPQKTAFVKEIL